MFNQFSFSDDEDINSVILQFLPKSCTVCEMSTTLKLWPHVAKNPILITVGHLKRIQLPILHCTNCSTANYPDMVSFGVFPLHNKCLISIDYILEIKDVLVSGECILDAWISPSIMIQKCFVQSVVNNFRLF